jgi:DNA-binding GntR family transcriptional regulator
MQLTHNDLATLIGTSRPTVSLAIAHLEQQKLIARRGRYISIENMDALSQAIAQL